MKYLSDLKYTVYSAEGISPLKLSFKHAQSKLYREARAFLIWLLVWKWSLLLAWGHAKASSELLWGGHLLSESQVITHKHIQPFGFCKSRSVCLFFLYKWEKEGKGGMGGRRLTHPAVENQKGLWSVIYAPLDQLCTDPNLRNRTGPY